MKDFIDRLPQNPNQYKMTNSSGTSEIVTIERADNPVTVGTPMNRSAMMAVQGMENSTTVFNDDGSISETYADGTLVTVFNDDGSITETFTAASGEVITKTTTFNSDGSISEVIS